MRNTLINIPIKPHLYKKWHIEKDFEADIFSHLRSIWYFCKHIPDIGFNTKLLDGIIVDLEWKTFYIEFKITNWCTFNMSQFEESQINFLEMLMKRAGEAWVMIFSVKTNTYWIGTYEHLKSQSNSAWWIKLFLWTKSNLLKR